MQDKSHCVLMQLLDLNGGLDGYLCLVDLVHCAASDLIGGIVCKLTCPLYILLSPSSSSSLL